MLGIYIFCFIFCAIFNNTPKQSIDKYFLDRYNISFTDIFETYELNDIEKKYVAHAGGKLDKYTYINNYEAVLESYNEGFRLIELDVEFTSDGVPIMLHSWDGFVTSFFNGDASTRYSYKQFMDFKMINDWHQLSLDKVIELMDTEFPEMYLITDTKNDNKKLLNIINDNYKYMKDRIIPQVYSQNEYMYAKELGFKNIIYTLYLSEDTREQIIDFAIREKPFAITMSTSWAYTDLPVVLSENGIYTYCHTINTVNEYDYLKKNGIKGIYTDTLIEKTK